MRVPVVHCATARNAAAMARDAHAVLLALALVRAIEHAASSQERAV